MNQGKNSAPRKAGPFPREATAVPTRRPRRPLRPSAGLSEHVTWVVASETCPLRLATSEAPAPGALANADEVLGKRGGREKARPAFRSQTPIEDAPTAPAGPLGGPPQTPAGKSTFPSSEVRLLRPALGADGGGHGRLVSPRSPRPAVRAGRGLDATSGTPQGPGTHAAPRRCLCTGASKC